MDRQPPSVEQLLEGLEVIGMAGDTSRPVTDVTQDSRLVTEGVLFVALRGERFDGNLFALQAAASGAPAVVSGDPPPSPLPADGTAWITVSDPRQALAALARRCHREPDQALQLVGVTGTNGKTTTVYLIRQMLEAAGHRCGLISGVELQAGGPPERAALTTPEADHFYRLLARMRDAGCTHCVMEVSSHALDRQRVAGARFRLAAWSNLSRDHLDYHPDMEHYYQAKKTLFTGLPAGDGIAVVNVDDESGFRLAGELPGRVVRCGTGEGADLRAGGIGADWSGTRLTLDGATLEGPLELKTPLIGRTNGENLMLAASVCLTLGTAPAAVAAGAAAFAGVPGRFQLITAPAAGFRVVVDYAHTDDALGHLLRSLRELTGDGRLITLFGCGGDRDPGKRPLMGRTAAGLSDQVVLTSDNPRTEDPLAIIAEVEQGVRQGAGPETGITVEPDRRKAIAAALALARGGDTVVVAGKGHEDYQILGRETVNFDDRNVVTELIREMENDDRRN
jgi:UDP-N-acetylmuramoyl-L-alanyl-D-glutamate--2,6-diaminopimelate ligase